MRAPGSKQEKADYDAQCRAENLIQDFIEEAQRGGATISDKSLDALMDIREELETKFYEALVLGEVE